MEFIPIQSILLPTLVLNIRMNDRLLEQCLYKYDNLFAYSSSIRITSCLLTIATSGIPVSSKQTLACFSFIRKLFVKSSRIFISFFRFAKAIAKKLELFFETSFSFTFTFTFCRRNERHFWRLSYCVRRNENCWPARASSTTEMSNARMYWNVSHTLWTWLIVCPTFSLFRFEWRRFDGKIVTLDTDSRQQANRVFGQTEVDSQIPRKA